MAGAARPTSDAQQPQFEIADVHNSTTLRAYVQSFGGVVREGLYIDRDPSMIGFIKNAYGVSEDDIAGGPGWMTTTSSTSSRRFPKARLRLPQTSVLQSLLADRFGLVVRHDTRPVPRYVLTIGKGGSELRAANR